MQALVERKDSVPIWLADLEKEKTRETYSRALKRLSEVSRLTPMDMLLEAQGNMKQFWVSIKADASKLKPHVRSSAISALRSYLRAHGEFPPYDRISRPRKSPRSARITWEEARKAFREGLAPRSSNQIMEMLILCGIKAHREGAIFIGD